MIWLLVWEMPSDLLLMLLPNFAPAVKRLALNGPALASIGSLGLKPVFEKKALTKSLDYYVRQNIELLQPREYEELVQRLVDVMYPIRPVPDDRKAHSSDKIGDGWQFTTLSRSRGMVGTRTSSVPWVLSMRMMKAIGRTCGLFL